MKGTELIYGIFSVLGTGLAEGTHVIPIAVKEQGRSNGTCSLVRDPILDLLPICLLRPGDSDTVRILCTRKTQVEDKNRGIIRVQKSTTVSCVKSLKVTRISAKGKVCIEMMDMTAA